MHIIFNSGLEWSQWVGLKVRKTTLTLQEMTSFILFKSRRNQWVESKSFTMALRELANFCIGRVKEQQSLSVHV